MREDTTYPHITLNARGVPCLDGTRHLDPDVHRPGTRNTQHIERPHLT
jgi:hypothetical protein